MTTTRTGRAAGVLAAVLFVGAACSSPDDTSAAVTDGESSADTAATAVSPARAGDVFPGDEWDTMTAEEAGMDQAVLDEWAADAEAAASKCLIITKDGYLIDEWYFADTNEASTTEAFSATKSITSAIVGIAQDQNLLDIDDKASDYITAWQGTDSEDITIRNLLSNDSGRFQDFDTDYIQMAAAAADKTQFSIDLDQQHPIGSKWVYNNSAIQTLDEVLRVATGQDPVEFAQEHLFDAIGMSGRMTADPSGNMLTFMGAQMSCRDMARFGLLFLRGGNWDGEQVISEEWVTESTTSSQELNPAYGYLWWLNDLRPPSGDEDGPPRKLVPGAPDGMYAAMGLGGQYSAVFPSQGVVAGRLAPTNPPTGVPQYGINRMADGVMAALGLSTDDDAAASGVGDEATGLDAATTTTAAG